MPSLPPSHAPAPADDHDFGSRLVALTSRVRTFVRRLVLRDDDDLVQETLARAWRFRAGFRPDAGTLDAWLMKIAFRTYLDQRAQRAPTGLGDHDVAVAAPECAPVEVRDEVAVALLQLSAVERDVLLRFHREFESIDEIARALAMPAGTVKSHLHRARQRLAHRRQP